MQNHSACSSVGSEPAGKRPSRLMVPVSDFRLAGFTQPPEHVARHDGVCPWCGKYLRRGKSRVKRLPRAIRPDVHVRDQRPRRWVHARCWHRAMAWLESQS